MALSIQPHWAQALQEIRADPELKKFFEELIEKGSKQPSVQDRKRKATWLFVECVVLTDLHALIALQRNNRHAF